MKTSDNFFEMYDEIWYRHPILKDFSCSKEGRVLYKEKKIVKPIYFNNAMNIIISYFKLKYYPLSKFVYECFYDLKDGCYIINKYNNKSNNIDNLMPVYLLKI